VSENLRFQGAGNFLPRQIERLPGLPCCLPPPQQIQPPTAPSLCIPTHLTTQPHQPTNKLPTSQNKTKPIQVYDGAKRVEHALKSIASIGHGGRRSVSAVPPEMYSRRFQEFMSRVFM